MSGDLLNPEFSGIGIQHIKISILFPNIAFQGIMKHPNIHPIVGLIRYSEGFLKRKEKFDTLLFNPQYKRVSLGEKTKHRKC